MPKIKVRLQRINLINQKTMFITASFSESLTPYWVQTYQYKRTERSDTTILGNLVHFRHCPPTIFSS